jgi:hypothetical protein
MSFQPRTIKLIGTAQRDTAIAMINNLPLGQDIEIVARKAVKARTLDQNSLMWAGPLADMEAQAFVEGRTYSDTVWHEFFKDEYLPEPNDPYIFELVKNPASYKKYDTDPAGKRRLVGSTTDLTKYGMSQYLEQIYAYGSKLGVMFTDVKHANQG